MAFTQDDLDLLDASIALGGGIQTIRFSDRETTFYSLDERLKLRALMIRTLHPSQDPTTRYASFSKGLHRGRT